MGQELVEDRALFVVVAPAHGVDALRGHQRLVPIERFLDLQRVIGEQLGGGVDAGEATANHHRRQAHLQVRQRVGLEGTGQLQGHQEVAGLADAAHQVVADVDHRGSAGARGNGHVIDAERPGVVERQAAAETHAAVDAHARATRQREVDQRQEVLVPAHGDAVLRDAAEAFEHAGVERTVQVQPARHRLRRAPAAAGQGRVGRLDLQAVDRDHAEALVQQVVRQRVAGRAETHHQHVLPVVRQRVRPLGVQRIPAREQPVDLDAPRQVQHVGERAGLDLRNVDRFLLLVDAGLHAVVADAMTGARAHRVVDHHHRQRADHVATLAQQVHLRDLLVERAAGQRDAERIGGDGALLVGEPLAAAVLVALVTEHAVVHLAQHLARAEARVGEREAIAAAQGLVRTGERLWQVGARPRDAHEVREVERLGEAEHHPVAHRRRVHVRGAPALQDLDLGGHRRLLLLVGRRPRGLVAIEQRTPGAGHGELAGAGVGDAAPQRVHVGVIVGRRLHGRAALQQRQRAAAHEVDFEAEEIVVGARGGGQRLGRLAHGEQAGDEAAHVGRQGQQQIGAVHRRGGGPGPGLPAFPQPRLGGAYLVDESGVQVGETGGLVQVREREVGEAQGISSRRRDAHRRLAPRRADQSRYIAPAGASNPCLRLRTRN